ncbi:MAG: TatD family hydrolase [Syntrophaceae bacterium]|nr:TatD family hydrolase [Syntrophaceae bacterium]
MLTGKCVDTHCHLDLYPDPAHIVQEINRIGLHVIAMTNAPFVFQATKSLAGDSGLIHPSIGLHPELVKTHGTQLSVLLERLQDVRFVGEVGLDYSERNEFERKQQRKVFESILQNCHEFGDKLVSIHSRRAVNDVIDIVGSGFRGTAILHWFAGTEKQLAAAHRNGLFFSINPAMISSNSGRRLIAAMHPSSVFTETDGPFINIDGKAAFPSNIEIIIKHLANIWNTSEVEVIEKIYDNFLKATDKSRRKSP